MASCTANAVPGAVHAKAVGQRPRSAESRPRDRIPDQPVRRTGHVDGFLGEDVEASDFVLTARR
jgi:hypothetical protein